MNMIELRKVLKTYLNTKCPRVFYENADDNAQFPYVVYNLPSSVVLDQREDFLLEVDVWDKNKDTSQIEALTDSIDGDGVKLSPSGLNRMAIYVDGKLAAKIWKENRNNIPDEDKTIKRRQLRYTIQTY